jgi:flagellar basal-body rod protein FlgB
MLSDVLNSGAIPSLELSLRFAGQRQRRIAHNIANISTPNFRHTDVSPAAFQQVLGRAVEDRRRETGGSSGELNWTPTQELRRGSAGQLHLVPRTTQGGVLAHDRNDRNLEKLMQDHAENGAVFRMSAELLRTRYQQIREAIAQRV